MKNALYVLRYAKRHISGQSDVEQWKVKPVALVVTKLHLVGRSVGRSGRQSVSKKFHLIFFLTSVTTCWKCFGLMWKLFGFSFT